MDSSRREFIKDVAVAGAVVAAGSMAESDSAEAETVAPEEETERCPYFDQPMYCKGLTKNGKPLCEE